MKQLILKYFLLTFLSVSVLTASVAQSDGKSRSRLNLGKKPTAGVASFKSPSSLDRSINVKPNAAINAYYRSVLLKPVATTTPTANKSRTSAETVASNANDARPNIEEAIKAEDILFSNDKVRVLNAYPNPANEYAEIDYQITGNVSSAKIALYNVLGANVADYDLDKNDRNLRISTREIPTGVYYYQLLLEGKKVATKKLLIRH
jgi:hypothetical protein